VIDERDAQHRVTGYRGRFWEPARLRSDEDQQLERRTGWLELFSDLVFVVVISELAHHLADHLDAKGLLEFVVLFVPVWWVWIGATVYAERFETRDFSFRLFTFLQMLPVAGMAVFSSEGIKEGNPGFAMSYIAARLIIIYLWWRGARHDPRFGPTAVRFNLGFTLSVMLWTVSLFVPPTLAWWLRAAGLACDLIAPLTTARLQERLPRISSSHFPERFGLFVIITLGEAIIGVIDGVARQDDRSVGTLLEGGLGMALVFAMWWVYFDFIGRRAPRPNIASFMPWSYLHLPLVMGITASSAGVLNALTADGAVSDGARWLMAGATALKLVTVGALEYTLRRDPGEPTHHHGSPWLKFAGAIFALLIGAFGGGLGSVGLMVWLFVPVLVQIVYGAWVWFNRYPDVIQVNVLEDREASEGVSS
jgi:low temperature requirement protein LtrA